MRTSEQEADLMKFQCRHLYPSQDDLVQSECSLWLASEGFKEKLYDLNKESLKNTVNWFRHLRVEFFFFFASVWVE